MKKLLSLVMVVCMMLSAVALGEGVVLQNEQPPVFVAAALCNAQGEVIAEITADAVLLTDVHQRTTVENAEMAARLTSAYEGVMEDVHHGDVECELHDHDVKVDITKVVSGLGEGVDAYDLIMYEMFDVCFGEELKAQLTEGAYVDLTLKIDEFQPLPIIVMYTKDGANWTIIPHTAAGENELKVQLPACGTMALLELGQNLIGLGKDLENANDPTTVVTEDHTPGNFTPSVSGKLAPTVTILPGTDGEDYVAIISSPDGSVVIKIPNRNYIQVTATAERDYTYDVQTHEHLEWAYDSIKNAANVGALLTEGEEGVTIAAKLDETLKAMGLDLTHDQLVVKDLFEVTAYGDYVENLYNEGYYLEMTFKTDLLPNQPAVVLHSYDSVHWHVHPIEEAQVNADGSITLRMYKLGTVALLVENPEAQMNAGELVTAP